MFYRVRVPEEDASVLRFLWWQNGDTSKPIIEYQMLVHIFGASSSPSCANFALRRTAEDNEREFGSMTTDSLRNNCYVDDYLKSVDEIPVSIRLAENVRTMCSHGGFNLTKWLSNSVDVMLSIPREHWSKELKDLDLDYDSLPIDRVLGVLWDVNTDHLCLCSNCKSGLLLVVESYPL
jgi:hypothetical protein